MILKYYLGTFIIKWLPCRDVEKASNEVYNYFETIQFSTLNAKTLSKDCLHFYENSQPIRDTIEHYNNLYTTCNTKLEKEIVEKWIFM